MFRDQSGNSSIEYALIAFLLGLLIIGCFAEYGDQLMISLNSLFPGASFHVNP